MSASEIVPVQLTLPSGTWFTLHQRGWDDADDDSLGFLGGDDVIYAFLSAEELSSYALSSDTHHLGPSPLWHGLRRWTRRDFSPAPDNCYDLTQWSVRGRKMLTELLVYLRIEPPKSDWNSEPMAAFIPARHSIYGVEMSETDPRPTGGPTIWHWLVVEVDGRVGPPPSDGDPTVGLAIPIEEVAPTVESVWLGLDGSGAHTLLVRDDEAGWAFLGKPGWVLASRSTAGLMTFVSSADNPALAAEPWTALCRRMDVDYEPYEDNIVDLDELGRSLNEQLDRSGAEALLDARPLMQELATWLELDEVVAAFDEDQPLGRFFVRDLLDLVGGSAGAVSRLSEVDFEPIEAVWQSAVSEMASRVHWVD